MEATEQNSSTSARVSFPVVIFVIIIIIIGSSLLVYFKFFSLKHQNNEPITPNFTYTVTSISASEIVITGKNGELQVPRTDPQVHVFKNNKEINESSLIVGQKIKLTVIPNLKIELFVQ